MFVEKTIKFEHLHFRNWYPQCFQVHSAGTIENAGCISVEGKDHPNESPEYNTKQSDGETPVLKLWGIWRTPSLQLLLGPHWPGMVTSDMVLSMGQIELCDMLNYVQTNDWC